VIEVLDDQNLITALMPQNLMVQESHCGTAWNISIDLIPEDGIWFSSASAYSEIESDSELRALRYGPTAQEALSASVYTLRETIEAVEQRRNKPEQLVLQRKSTGQKRQETK